MPSVSFTHLALKIMCNLFVLLLSDKWSFDIMIIILISIFVFWKTCHSTQWPGRGGSGTSQMGSQWGGTIPARGAGGHNMQLN